MPIKFLNDVAVDSSVLYVDTINNRVGIGTSSPSETFTLQTQATGLGNEGIFIKNPFAGTSPFVNSKSPFLSLATSTTSAYNSTIYMGSNATATNQESKIEWSNANDGLSIYVKGTGTYREHVRFGNLSSSIPRTYFGGNVGIGTTSPSNILHIQSASATGAVLNLETTHSGGIPIYNMKGAHSAQLRYQDENGNNQSRIDFNDGGDFNFVKATDGTSHLKITSSGNVGIGTTSPSASLSIDKTNVYQHRALDLENDSITYSMYIDQDNVGTDSWSLFDTTNSQTALKYLPSASGYWQFYTNNAERLRIDSSGRVGISTTSPSEKLEVNGNIKLSETAAATDTDKFVVLDSGVLKYRTGAQVRSDIGAGTGDITGVTAGTYLTGGGTSGNVTINADSTQLAHIHDSSNGTVAAGWITVAQASDARKAGEIYVTDGESSDHSYIRIEWMRSYADSNFTVLNCGGHANRIVGVRVLEETADKTYGKKYIQVKVTTTSNYYVIVTAPGSIPMYGDFTAETPVLENTKTGYNVKGSQLENLQESSVGTDQGITVGGDLFVDGNVGIGTTSPGVKLQVGDGTNDDAVRSYMNDGSYTEMRGYGLQFSRAASYMRPTADNTKTLYLGSNVAQWNTLSIDASTTTFNTNGSENMRITSTGNVGIGTTSPVDKLQIDAPHSQLRLRDTDDGTFTQFSSSGNKLAIRQNSTSANHIWLTSSGNVGIGTSSPTADLSVGSTSTSSGDVHLRTTKTTFSMTPSNTDAGGMFLDVGWASGGQGPFRFGIGGSEKMRIDSSGRVGLGTSSPSAKLQVKGSGTSPIVYFGNGVDNAPNRQLAFSGGSSGLVYDLDATGASGVGGQLTLSTNGSERVRIDSSGRVGIGTTSPGGKLHVKDSSTSPGVIIESDGGNEQFVIKRYSNTNEQLILGFHSSDYGTIQAVEQGVSYRNLALNALGGNVGIGTTSPSSLLHVLGSPVATSGALITVRNSDATSSNTTFGGIMFNSFPGTDYSIGKSNVNSATTLSFRNANTGASYMDIDSSGNVGIGTTSPSSAVGFDAKLQLESANPMLVYKETDQSTKWEVGAWGGSYVVYNGTNERMRIRSTGNVGIGTTSPTQKLDVNGDIAIKNATQLSFNSNNGTLSVASQAGQLDLKSSSIFINYSSNVGIGTTSPSQKLDVVGSIEVSDGIYVGGTATANKLDDYEEGTFDLEWGYARMGGVSYYDLSDFGGTKSETSRYVKIGRHVTVTSYFQYGTKPTAWTDTSAYLYLKLPFTVAQGYYGNGAYYSFPGASNAASPTLYPTSYSSASSLLGLQRNTTGFYSDFQSMQVGDFPGSGPSGYASFRISFSFYTTD